MVKFGLDDLMTSNMDRDSAASKAVYSLISPQSGSMWRVKISITHLVPSIYLLMTLKIPLKFGAYRLEVR